MSGQAELERAFRDGVFSGQVPGDVTAPVPAEIAARFAVYRNNVLSGLVAALRRRFPVVERLVGEAFARAMFGEFARAHPPRSPLMMEYGADMPGFIEDFAPAGGLPYLADVARLECARGRAYHAADVPALDAAALAEAVGRDPELLRFRLRPCVETLFSRHPVFSIWAMNQPGAVAGPVAVWGPEQGLVARAGLEVVTAPLPRGEAVFIVLLCAGESFARAAEAGGTGFDPAPPLARLISAGLITGAG